MSPKFTVWSVALLCAIVLHAVVLNLPSPKNLYDVASVSSDIELILLPQATQESQPSISTQRHTSDDLLDDSLALQDTLQQENDLSAEIDLSVDDTDGLVRISPKAQSMDTEGDKFIQDATLSDVFSTSAGNTENVIEAETPKLDVSSRSSLLDLSQIDLTNQTADETDAVFSRELREQIAAAQKARQEYINSLPAEKEDYAMTRDSDGTRYVNIKGVCWRLPKEGSNEGWAIVFDGCGIKSRLFHLELNISPKLLMNEILGPDSPINQHFQTD